MPDYIFMLESRLSPEQQEVLNRVQQEAQEASLNIYLVGGAVRDLMTGSPIRDLDFATEGNPHRVARRLQDQGVRRIETDNQLRATELVLADGISLSLEMARNEFFPQPGKPPEVRPASILEDLRRRDFSVNAMGISLTPGSRGLLLDPTNGLADVEKRELRILHNYSFLHDPVRLLRLVRFAARLGFRLEARTEELFQAALERGYQNYIRPSALAREAEQIAREENGVAVLKNLEGHELLTVFHPQLQRRKPDYAGLAKLQRYRQQAEESGYRLALFYSVLYYSLRRLKPGVQKRLMRNLGMKKAQVKEVLAFEKEARKVVKLLGRQRKLGPRQIYHLLSPVPVELLVFILAQYSSKKKVRAKVYNYLFKYRPLRAKLPVRELQLMGVAPGPKFDQILEKYFEAVLDGKLRGRAQQLRFLRKVAGIPKPKVVPPKKARPRKEKAARPPEPAERVAPPKAETPAAPATTPTVREKPGVKNVVEGKPKAGRGARARRKPAAKRKPKAKSKGKLKKKSGRR